jgi:hypothetical protein
MATIGSLSAVGDGRNEMKRFCAGCAVVAFGGWVFVATANAAPPTATPSPGYDARLQEQRAARTVYEPVIRTSRPISRHRAKRILGTR